MSKRGRQALLCLLLILLPAMSSAAGAYYYQMPLDTDGIDLRAHTVIGAIREYVLKDKDTLLEVARRFDLGYLEMILVHSEMDPWLPPAGKKIIVPTTWILPYTPSGGIVINVPELRLYFFLDKIQMVRTYPIGIGVREGPTPFGNFHIVEKTVNPTWHIPASLQEKYGRTHIPPGPDNPLGRYWLRLSNYDYGIHGTNTPWGIGRLVSHGCIRLYPEDIQDLFRWVQVGTSVQIVYEPVKVGFKEGRIFIEIHPDIYERIPDLLLHAQRVLAQKNVLHDTDLDLLIHAVAEQRGVPVDVTANKKGR
jgi:L,D-transpeptidase ErfK/SrfK